MEVLKISDSKLKIMLTKSDMQKYGLIADKVDYNDSATRRSFFEILDRVKTTHGFDADGDKVLIQFYPSKDGGCELFVTKLGLIPPSSERTIAKSDRVTMLATKRQIYKFVALKDLQDALRQIRNSFSAKRSDVFYDADGGLTGEYYLEILERGSGNPSAISEFDVLLEFSERVDKALIPYITEHYQRLTDGNAIESFYRNNS